MIELKFRAWDPWYETMHENVQFGIYVDPDDMIPFEDVIQLNYKIMQYTGMVDKNGREMYQGDIIKYNDKSYIVSWHKGCWIANLIDKSYYFALYDNAKKENDKYYCNDYTVIGNIFKNHELLEENNEM